MKIGILTYHNTINFGASLQTYSMVSTLRKAGLDAEIIDYRNKAIVNRTEIALPKVNPKSLLKYPVEVLKHQGLRIKESTFQHFAREYMQLSKQAYFSPSDLENTQQVYDFFFVGSDQVWNFKLNGMDSSYFLDFVENKGNTASFASSFGLSEIPEHLHEFYSSGLKNLQHISVREQLGADLVRNLTGAEAQVNADPVFLTSPEEWRYLANDHKKENLTNIFATYFLGPELRAKANSIISGSKLSNSVEMKLAGGLGIKDLLSRKTNVRMGRGPIEFLQVIAKSQFVLTGSFHATAFAILLDRPFGVLLKGDVGKDARILELLETFSLTDRVVEKAEDLNFDQPSAQTDSLATISKLRNESMAYLKNVLKV